MASGNTLAVFDAFSARPPVSDYPQIDLRNGHAVLDFDDTTAEQTDFFTLLPSSYSGGGLVVRLLWAATSATGGSVRWRVSVERHTSGFDLDSSVFGSEVVATSVANSSAGGLSVATLSLTAEEAQSPAAGDSVRLRIGRAIGTADTLPGDAELLAVELKEA